MNAIWIILIVLAAIAVMPAMTRSAAIIKASRGFARRTCRLSSGSCCRLFSFACTLADCSSVGEIYAS